jgi:hypothetical protein
MLTENGRQERRFSTKPVRSSQEIHKGIHEQKRKRGYLWSIVKGREGPIIKPFFKHNKTLLRI